MRRFALSGLAAVGVVALVLFALFLLTDFGSRWTEPRPKCDSTPGDGFGSALPPCPGAVELERLELERERLCRQDGGELGTGLYGRRCY